MCLLDVFRNIPGIQERGLALEESFRSRYLYDQKELSVDPIDMNGVELESKELTDSVESGKLDESVESERLNESENLAESAKSEKTIEYNDTPETKEITNPPEPQEEEEIPLYTKPSQNTTEQ